MNSFLRSYEIEQRQNTSREKVSPCPKGKNFNFCNGVVTGDEESRFMISHQGSCSIKVHKDGSAFHGRDVNGDERDVVSETEMLNETDAYKYAIEEELQNLAKAAQKWTPQSVISIDDEDDDGTGELDSDASTSKRFRSALGRMQNSVHIDVDDCDVYSVSRMQKKKEAFSAKAADKNCYGLYGSESESSDTDCEVMEKVSAKRKRPLFNDQFCRDEHVSSSGLHSNKHIDIGVENRTRQHRERPVYSGSSNGIKDDSQGEWFYFNPKTDNSFKDSDQKVEKENCTSPKSKSMEEAHSFRQSSDIEQGEKTSKVKVAPCPKSKNCNFCNGVTGASRCNKELGGEESKFMSLCQDACDNQVENDGSALRSKDENFCEVNSNFASFDERHVNGDAFGLPTQDADLSASKVRDLINEKEKLKETDENEQAMEEKWASRQRPLQNQEKFEPQSRSHFQSTRSYPSMHKTLEDERVQPHKRVDVAGGKNKGKMDGVGEEATHLNTSHASVGGSHTDDPMIVADMASRLAAVERERQELQSKVDQMAVTQSQMFALVQQLRPPVPPLPLPHHYGGHQYYYMPPLPQQFYHGLPPPFTQQYYWLYYPIPHSQSQMQPRPEL